MELNIYSLTELRFSGNEGFKLWVVNYFVCFGVTQCFFNCQWYTIAHFGLLEKNGKAFNPFIFDLYFKVSFSFILVNYKKLLLILVLKTKASCPTYRQLLVLWRLRSKSFFSCNHPGWHHGSFICIIQLQSSASGTLSSLRPFRARVRVLILET